MANKRVPPIQFHGGMDLRTWVDKVFIVENVYHMHLSGALEQSWRSGAPIRTKWLRKPTFYPFFGTQA